MGSPISSAPVSSRSFDFSAFAALKDDGSVVTWGSSEQGGDSSGMTDRLSSGVDTIFSAASVFAALKEDGSVVTWGTHSRAVTAGGGRSARSGVDTIFSANSAFAASRTMAPWSPGATPTEALTAAVWPIGYLRHRQDRRLWMAFAALKDDGSVVTWGKSDQGGDSSGVADQLGSGVVQIFSTSRSFAALKDDGPLSPGGTQDTATAVGSPISSAPMSSRSFRLHAFAALKEDGSVVTWGSSERAVTAVEWPISSAPASTRSFRLLMLCGA